MKNPRDGIKILGGGELTKKLTVQVNAFSASAKEKIEALGGKAEVIFNANIDICSKEPPVIASKKLNASLL